MRPKHARDTEGFEQRTEELRNIFYKGLHEAMLMMLDDKSNENVEKGLDMLSDRIEECEVKDIGHLIAQAAIVAQMLNKELVEEEWN